MNNQSFRSVDDIENESIKLINEISKDRKKAKFEVRSLIKKIEDAIEDIEAQTSDIVSGLNANREQLEKTFNSGLNSAYQNLKEPIDIFKRNSISIKNAYKRSLLVLFMTMVFLIFFYNSLISYIPWLNYTFVGIPCFQVFIIFFVSIILLNSYRKANILINYDSVNLDLCRKKLSNDEISLKDINLSKTKIENSKSYLEFATDFLDVVVTNVEKSIPFIKQTYQELNLLVEYKQMIGNFERAIVHYKLLDDPEFFREIGKLGDFLISSGRLEYVPKLANIT